MTNDIKRPTITLQAAKKYATKMKATIEQSLKA